MADTRIDLVTRVRGSREVQNLNKRIDKLDEVVRGVQKSLGSISLSAIGAAAATLGPRLVQAFTAPIRSAGDLQFELSGVKALIRSQFDDAESLEKAFAELSNQAKKLGAETQFTATQAAQGMQFLARAGFEAKEIIDALPGTLNLAAVENIDLATAADIASNVITGTGQDISEFDKVVDILAGTTTASNTSLIQLAEALKTAAPVATAAGVSLDELSASVGVLGNGGLQASIAGTSLRKIISSLTTPTDKASRALSKLGLTFDDFVDGSGDFIGVADSVELFEKNLLKLGGTAEKSRTLRAIFGDIGNPGFSVLLQQGSDELKSLTQRVNNTGTASKIAEDRFDNFQGSVVRLQSAFEAFLIQSGEPFLDVLAELIDSLRDAIVFVTNFSDEFPRLTEFLTDVVVPIFQFTASVVTLGGVLEKGADSLDKLGVSIEGVNVRIPILREEGIGLTDVIGGLLNPLALLDESLDLGEAFDTVIFSTDLFRTKLGELGGFLVGSFQKTVLQAGLAILRLADSTSKLFSGSDRSFATDTISALERQIQQINEESSKTLDGAFDERALGRVEKNLKALDDRIAASRKRISDNARKQERIDIQASLKQERIANNEREKVRIENANALKKEIASIEKFALDSEQTINSLFSKQAELIKLEFSGDEEKQEAELERITQLRIQREEEVARKRLQATEQIRQARIKLIDDEQEAALQSLAFRQRRELERIRSSGTSEQVNELQKIQEQERDRLLVSQIRDNEKSRLELEQFISDARVRIIEDSFEKEAVIFKQRQEDELSEFRQLASEKIGLSEEEIDARVQQLERVQQKERELFEERRQLEEQERNRGLDREFLDLELQRTNDPLEQIRLQGELELSEFQSLQERKLEQLRDFGASEQQLDEQRLLAKQDLARREQELRREAFDAQLALSAETLSNARNVSQTLLDISKGNSKELFAITQGLAIAEATVNVARAISNSIGEQGFFGIAQAAIAGAAAAAELAKISAVTLGFNQGGIVPGNTSVNRDTVPAVLTPGEAVIPQAQVKAFGPDFFNGIIRGTISPNSVRNVPGRGISSQPFKTRFNTGGIASAAPREGGQRQSERPILVQNQVSNEVFFNALSSPSGVEILTNVIKDNQDDIFDS